MWCHCALYEVIEGFVRLWNRLDIWCAYILAPLKYLLYLMWMGPWHSLLQDAVMTCAPSLMSYTRGPPLFVGLLNCVVWWWKGGLYNPSIFLEKENFGPLCWELKCFMPCDHFGECKLECDFVQIMIWCVHVWDVMILLFR